MDQGFQGRHYFWPVLLHEEAFVVIAQTKVESQTKNIGPLLLSNLIELRKSLFPALAEEKMTMETFKDINTFYKQRVPNLK